MAFLVFLFRMRIAVAAGLVLASTAAAFVAFYGHAVPVGALFLSAVSLAVAAAVAFAHLRHAGLAALAALSPLPGMIAARLLAPEIAYSELFAVYGFATLAAALLCGDIVRGVLNSETPVDAARSALARGLAPASAVLVPAALVAGWLIYAARPAELGVALEFIAASVSVFAVVPFAASVLPFGENFFVAANRAREGRERRLRLAALSLEPRWGLSLGGIALVFAVLGWFGAEPFLARTASAAELAMGSAVALPVFLMAFGVGRDWREALATTLAIVVLALLSLWLWGQATGHLTAAAFVEIAVILAASVLAMLMLLWRSRAYRLDGDAPGAARLRACEDFWPALWFGSLGAAAAIAPWIVLHGSIAILAILYVPAGAAAALALPAIATALDALVPRRRSLNQLYGRG